MTLLLFLNLGGTQSYVESTDAGLNGRAAVFRWIDASWVLPTLALAYAIQFIIDTVSMVFVFVNHKRGAECVYFRPWSMCLCGTRRDWLLAAHEPNTAPNKLEALNKCTR